MNARQAHVEVPPLTGWNLADEPRPVSSTPAAEQRQTSAQQRTGDALGLPHELAAPPDTLPGSSPGSPRRPPRPRINSLGPVQIGCTPGSSGAYFSCLERALGEVDPAACP